MQCFLKAKVLIVPLLTKNLRSGIASDISRVFEKFQNSDFLQLIEFSKYHSAVNSENLKTKVLYMPSSFGLLGIDSRDICQAEKERTACKAEQIHKMTNIFHSKWS